MKIITGITVLLSYLMISCSSVEKTSAPESATQPEPTVVIEPVSAPVVTNIANRLPSNLLRTNNDCLDIIKESEGLRLDAYSDQMGNWFIGYGHKDGVTEGMKITEAQAEKFLQDDLTEFEQNITRLVEVDVTENEFSAMVCLSYNIGSGNFGQSTVLRRVNEQAWAEAADAILLWNKVNGQVNSHLVTRREKERELFLKIN